MRRVVVAVAALLTAGALAGGASGMAAALGSGATVNGGLIPCCVE